MLFALNAYRFDDSISSPLSPFLQLCLACFIMTDKQERLFEVMMRSVLNLRVNKEGITYKKFCGLYFSQWYSNFEDDARKEGFINGFNAIRSVEGVSLNGSIITVTSTNKIVQEIADVMAASVSKPKQVF